MEEIIMALYENTIRLKGFVGKNALQETANDPILRLAAVQATGN